jgi:hypothetical protein
MFNSQVWKIVSASFRFQKPEHFQEFRLFHKKFEVGNNDGGCKK